MIEEARWCPSLIDEEFVVHDIKVIEGDKGIVHRNAEQKGRGRGIPRHSLIRSIRTQESGYRL